MRISIANWKCFCKVREGLWRTLKLSCPLHNSQLTILSPFYRQYFLEKTNKPPPKAGYRRLRIFSGAQPVPTSEEQFDPWLEQVRLLVEESERSDREKKRRLMESLKGPPTRMQPLQNTWKPWRVLLEPRDDLYFAFWLLQQQLGEKLSDFLRRLECSL